MSKTSINTSRNSNASAVILVTHLKYGPLFARLMSLRKELGSADAVGCKTRFRLEIAYGEASRGEPTSRAKSTVFLTAALLRTKRVSIFAEHSARKNLRRGDREDPAPFVQLATARTSLRYLQKLGLIPLVDFLAHLEDSSSVSELLLQAAQLRRGSARKTGARLAA